MGSGGGKMVSMLAVYSDNPSSNPIEVYSFYSVKCLKITKINKKEAEDDLFLRLQFYSVNCLKITKINKNEAGDVPIFFKKKMTEEKSKKTKNK